MKNKLKECPACHKPFMHRIENKCPHCEVELDQQRKVSRTCPSCGHSFKQSKRVNNIPHCPKCQTPLYFPTGRMQGQTLLQRDKDTCQQIVTIVEEHIGKREKCEYVFEGSERNAQITHAYALLDRSKTFFRRNNEKNLDPHDFTIDLLKRVLKDGWWGQNLKSLAQIRSSVGQFALELYKQKRSEAKSDSFQELMVRSAMGQDRSYIVTNYSL